MNIKEFDVLLHDAEIKLKRLKALYEQWFQGIEKMEPVIPKKDLERTLVLLRKERPRNTAARFRLQQLQARYNTYLTYWGRISRRIEEGTYDRDIKRARRRRGKSAAVASDKPKVKEFEIDLDQEIEIDVDGLAQDNEIDAAINALAAQRESAPPTPARPGLTAFSPFALGGDAKRASQKPPPGVKPAQATFGKPRPSQPTAPKIIKAPRPPRPGSGAPPSRGGDGARGDAQTRQLYDAYVAARRRNNERVDNLDYAKMEKSISKMRSRLKQKHGNKRIDFEVVVKDGRVGLKPKIG